MAYERRIQEVHHIRAR